MALTPDTLVEAFENHQPLSINESDLAAAENILVERFLPPYKNFQPEELAVCTRNWGQRRRLVDDLKERGFFGRLIDVSIDPLDNPVDSLLKSGCYPHRHPKDPAKLIANVVGFTVTAAIRSSNSAYNGNIKRAVWLLRREPNFAREHDTLWGRVIGKEQGQNTIKSSATSLATGRPLLPVRRAS